MRLKACLMIGSCVASLLAVTSPLNAQTAAAGTSGPSTSSPGMAKANTAPPPAKPKVKTPPTKSRNSLANKVNNAGEANETSQNLNASSASSVQSVVVTAENRTRKAQNVPVADYVYSDARRNLLGIETEKDITNYTPSMSLNGQFLSLRGIGRYTNSLGTDPGVAVYVDGIYTNSPDYLNQPDFLTNYTEVLEGPQSIYGRNAIGGAINIVSKKPTDTFYAEARVGYTNYNDVYTDLAASGPLTDTLRARVAYAFSNQSTGFQENLAPNAGQLGQLGAATSRLWDTQLQWDPTENLDVWLRYQNSSSNTTPTYVQIYGGYQSGSLGNYDGLVPNPQFGLIPNSNPALRDPFDVSIDNPGSIDITHDNTVTAHITYTFPFATLRYLGGYSTYVYNEKEDADFIGRPSVTYAVPGGFTTLPTRYVIDTKLNKSYYSHELNLTSNSSGAFKWVVGAFYYSENDVAPYYMENPDQPYFATPLVNAPPFGPAAPNPRRTFYGQTEKLSSDSQAVYAQLSYTLTPKLSLTAGGRYNWDEKRGTSTYNYVYDGGGYALDVTPANNNQSRSYTWSNWTGKLGLQYQVGTNTLAYASVAKGYKSGGFDLGNYVPIPVVQPEELTAYEIGFKTTPTRSLLINTDVYYYDYHDLQVPIYITSPTGLITPTLTNAQRARTYGYELSTIYSPLSNLHLTFTYSWINAKFLGFTNKFGSGGLVDISNSQSFANLRGNTLPQSPRNKLSFDPQYVVHLGKLGDLSLSANLAWVDTQYYGIFSNSNYRAPAYYNLDLRAVFQPKRAHWTAILYGRNVTDTLQIVNFAPNAAGIATQNIYYANEPQVFGGELQYRF